VHLVSSKTESRPPAVAGKFYPSDNDELFEIIHWSFTHPIGPGKYPSKNQTSPGASKVECLVAPHAGYQYSGPVAAHSYQIAHDFFQRFKDAEEINLVVLGPNHYGMGSGVALSPADFWETPLGKVKVNTKLVKKISAESSIIDIDSAAHSREHSIEVQLPFVQAMAGPVMDRISFIPLSLMLQDLETTMEITSELTKVIKESNTPFLFLGSSDLTHYESQQNAVEKDARLLQEIQKLDAVSFYNILQRLNVTACGYGAISIIIQISKAIGKKTGSLLKYATSGETSGDTSSVVGYSSVHFV
jgi:AmmeMemoRadiSam system protein B